MNNKVLLKIASVIIGIAIFILIAYIAFNALGAKAADLEPRDVVVSNIEKNSVRLSWATGVDTQAVVEYGTSPTALNFFAPETSSGKSHDLDLTLLSPGTTYYFDIRIGDKKYDNGGVPWTFTTKNVENSVAVPTAVPTFSSQPTPIQRLEVSDGTSCTDTDCAVIKTKLGKGCSTQDYFKCIMKLTSTPAPTATATPTL